MKYNDNGGILLPQMPTSDIANRNHVSLCLLVDPFRNARSTSIPPKTEVTKDWIFVSRTEDFGLRRRYKYVRSLGSSGYPP